VVFLIALYLENVERGESAKHTTDVLQEVITPPV
jgi:hypothetical protein